MNSPIKICDKFSKSPFYPYLCRSRKYFPSKFLKITYQSPLNKKQKLPVFIHTHLNRPIPELQKIR